MFLYPALLRISFRALSLCAIRWPCANPRCFHRNWARTQQGDQQIANNRSQAKCWRGARLVSLDLSWLSLSVTWQFFFITKHLKCSPCYSVIGRMMFPTWTIWSHCWDAILHSVIQAWSDRQKRKYLDAFNRTFPRFFIIGTKLLKGACFFFFLKLF